MVENRIKITKTSIIYVCCPAYYKTGGTELLHQLVYEINTNTNIKAFITYYNSSNEYLNPAFSKYVNEYKLITDIVDCDNNVIIVPEVFTKILLKYNNIRKIIWWESVDNYLINSNIFEHYKFSKSIISCFKYLVKKYCFNKNTNISIKSIRKNVDLNFVQSIYAKNYLIKNNINNIYFLSDYINDIYLVQSVNYDIKENVVCYNPKKGFKFTKKLSKKAVDIKFVPIINMSNAEVMETLKRSKVYIDFGNHPGKDRIPREAAMLGCAVITNKRGSAKFKEDVFISEEYKFDDKYKNIDKIIQTIRNIFLNYPNVIMNYEEYRNRIKLEKSTFKNDAISWFVIVD